MTTITGVNHPLFPNRTSIQAADAAETAEQILNSYYATSAGGGSAQIDTGANALTGSSGSPPLSSDLVGALINDQAQQAATNSASAASGAEKGAASTGTAAPPSGSAPLTLQQIAGRYDIHHLAADQAAQLREDLVKSGALSHDDARNLFLINAIPSESFGHWDGHHLTGVNDVPTPAADSTFDETQRVQTRLTSDRYFGNAKNASAEQDILNVLNSLDQLSTSRTA
jgi:hypothetical protein